MRGDALVEILARMRSGMQDVSFMLARLRMVGVQYYCSSLEESMFSCSCHKLSSQGCLVVYKEERKLRKLHKLRI